MQGRGAWGGRLDGRWFPEAEIQRRLEQMAMFYGISTARFRGRLMMKYRWVAVACVVVAMSPWTGTGAAEGEADEFWPTWRGPRLTGMAPNSHPPTEWSETTNIRWKVGVPGRGMASPVIWGDKVFVLTAVPVGTPEGDGDRVGLFPGHPHRFSVIAYDRTDGSVVWTRVAREEAPHEGAHQENGSWASGSAVTDGEHVFAYFGSRGLYCFTIDGELVWEADFGDKRMRNEFGEGSTPALAGDTIVVVWDHLDDSFVVALDKRTGAEQWRAAREEIDTWATPLVVEHESRWQVIVGAMNRIVSYDLKAGSVMWHGPGLTMNAIPSPVSADGFVYLTSGFRGNSLKAIRLDRAIGDITDTNAVVWSLDRDTPYVPSPLLYEDTLYLLKSNSGVLSAFDAKTGAPHYQVQRLPNVPNVVASPVGAGGHVYLPGREGTTLVIRHGSAFEVVATNRLDDGFDASPAVVGDELYLRGHRYLYSIGTL